MPDALTLPFLRAMRPARGLGFVWLVQHSGFPGEGNKAQGAFKKAAEEQFAKQP